MGHPRLMRSADGIKIKINVKGNGQECPFHTCLASLRSADSPFGFAQGRLSGCPYMTCELWRCVRQQILRLR